MYYPRISDKILAKKLRVFGATNIVGPKWCGKTSTAKNQSKSSIFLQEQSLTEDLIYVSKINPQILLDGEKPRLIDEWQDAPNLWDAIRTYCDKSQTVGNFILTGSTSKKVKTKHTGTGRISTMKMYPMSLFESKESTGDISLSELFNNTNNVNCNCVSKIDICDVVFAACRGGWPASLLIKEKEDQLLVAKDYFEQLYNNDLYSVDDVKRNSSTMKSILRSYARNISTLAKKNSLLKDVNSTTQITDKTLDDYIDVLEQLFVVEDIYGWCPQIRSKTAMRSGRKREFVDPSIAVAALGGSPKYYLNDLRTFGFIFENLCIRDLKVYSQALGGEISYYRDNLGLEADCVLHLDDGRYALIEFKLGDFEIDSGASNLNKLEELIIKHNKESDQKIRVPDLKIVITATKYGYKRPDGVFVVPIGCLKD